MPLDNAQIKKGIGRQIKVARKKKRLSRAALGKRLGISPKTIQSWEMGRTFIERLALIPNLEAELDVSLSKIIATAANENASSDDGDPEAEDADATVPMKGLPTACTFARPRPGPFPLYASQLGALPSPEEHEAMCRHAWVSMPILTADAILNRLAELRPRDVKGWVIAPASWAPRDGVMAAYRMDNSGMSPVIALNSMLVLDLRPLEPEKAMGKTVVFRLAGKGLRVRRMVHDGKGRFFAAPGIGHSRRSVQFRLDAGDAVIGRVVGVMSGPSITP